MRILKWIAGVLGLALLVLSIGVMSTRSGDGPRGPFPGGALVAGDLVEVEPDWTFARDIEEMEIQLLDPVQSRITWLQVYDKKLYVVSGYMNSTVGKIWKKWPAEAVADGRAVIRVDGKRYERQLVRIIDDGPVLEGIAAELKRKYDVPLTSDMAASGDAWFFAVGPRS
jgi:hypothetical protein